MISELNKTRYILNFSPSCSVVRFPLHSNLPFFIPPSKPLLGFCSTMAFCSTPPLSSPLSHSLQNPTGRARAPLAYPPSGGPSYALHFRAKRGIRFSDLPHPPPRLKVLCSSDYNKAAAVTGDSWEKSILNSETPVLVEFYASWCGPCRMVHRVIDEIAEDYAGRLKCFVLNTDSDVHIAEKYEIKAVPVVLLFKNGEKRESVVGTMPKNFYVAAIERVLAS